MGEVVHGSVILGALGMLVVIAFFIAKAIVGHVAAHLAIRAIHKRRKKNVR